MRNLLRKWLTHRYFWQAFSLSIAAGGWEVVGRANFNPAIPSFSSTMASFFEMVADGTLARAYGSTLQPLIAGLGFAAVVGVVFGIAIGLSRTLEWATGIVFIALQAAPMAAVIPLIVYVYGIGFAAKFAAVVVLAAPGITLNSYRGIRNVNPSLVEMSQSFLASRWHKIVKVIIPAASGMIITSLRMGLAAAFVGVVLAELLITPTGIGDCITYFQCLGEFPKMYATILSIVALAAVSVSLLQVVENRFFRPEKRVRRHVLGGM
jgi:NitT/TauT family transport system permease protein